MEFIFDLLVLPEGPRLRDKLSHGEVDLKVDKPANSVVGPVNLVEKLFNPEDKVLDSMDKSADPEDKTANNLQVDFGDEQAEPKEKVVDPNVSLDPEDKLVDLTDKSAYPKDELVNPVDSEDSSSPDTNLVKTEENVIRNRLKLSCQLIFASLHDLVMKLGCTHFKILNL